MSTSRKVQAFSEYTLSLHRKANTNILVIISMSFFFFYFLPKQKSTLAFSSKKQTFENIWLCRSMCRQNTRHKEKPKESGDQSAQTS